MSKGAEGINKLRIKAIETKYKGYRFRSRLEARWAVFFDEIKVSYDYEPEGYDLGKLGYYLPDFYLPTLDCFIEVKPGGPTQEEWEKCRSLHEMTGKSVFMCMKSPITIPGNGEIPHENGMWAIPSRINGTLREVEWGDNWFDDPYIWSQCPECETVGITFFGDVQDLSCGCFAGRSLCDCIFGTQSDDLKKAFKKARAARFEHGEVA